MLINKRLNVDEAQEIRNINHHANLLNFSFGEIKFVNRDIARIKINR